MSEVLDFINRVLDKTKIKRELFSDNKAPETVHNLRVVPFFGDIKSEFLLSTTLLRKIFPNDYLVVYSWPGHYGIYDQIDEFWSPQDENTLEGLARAVNGFDNDKGDLYERLLLRYFDKVSVPSDFVSKYYSKGFTSEYFKQFQKIEYNLPSIPSVNVSFPEGFEQDKSTTVLLSPVKFANHWQRGGESRLMLNVKFWNNLVGELLKYDIVPILIQNYSTFDLSPEWGAKCLYVTDSNLLSLLGLMRSCDCVLDIFNGYSRYALIARCPVLVCDERQRYFNTFDYILDDLFSEGIPQSRIFSFATIANHSGDFLFKSVTNRLLSFLKEINRDALPSTVELSKCLSYDKVKKRNNCRIGAKFIQVPKISY